MSCKFFNEWSSQALRDYLECTNIYKGNLPKKKIDLIEMIVYGCITEKLNKKGIEDISTKQANGYGNALLKRKEIKPYAAKEKLLIKI